MWGSHKHPQGYYYTYYTATRNIVLYECGWLYIIILYVFYSKLQLNWALNTQLYKTPPTIHICQSSIKANYSFITFWIIVTLNKHIFHHRETPPEVTCWTGLGEHTASTSCIGITRLTRVVPRRESNRGKGERALVYIAAIYLSPRHELKYSRYSKFLYNVNCHPWGRHHRLLNCLLSLQQAVDGRNSHHRTILQALQCCIRICCWLPGQGLVFSLPCSARCYLIRLAS